MDLASSKNYYVNGIMIASDTSKVIGPTDGGGQGQINLGGGGTAYTLGSAVTGSSLTSLGTLNSLNCSGDINLVNNGSLFGGSGAANVLTLRSASGNTNHSRIEVGTSEASDNGGVHIYTAGATVATRRITIKGTSGHVLPGADNAQDLGSSTLRWANVYTGDMHLNNMNSGGNEVDGSEGHWTMQEGSDDLFLINRNTGKKYKINLTEVS